MYFLYLQFSQKTNKKIWLYYYGTSSWIIFIRFLGELKAPKRHFKINWPLVHTRNFTVCMKIHKKVPLDRLSTHCVVPKLTHCLLNESIYQFSDARPWNSVESDMRKSFYISHVSGKSPQIRFQASLEY